jgi:predicted peptidase
MGNYQTIANLTDNGPCIQKILLELPCEIGVNDVTPQTFNVYVERRNKTTGEVVIQMDYLTMQRKISRGYRDVVNAYPCDATGKACARSYIAALEMKFEPLGRPIEGDVMASGYIDSVYRITQLVPLPEETVGLVFDTCTKAVTPEIAGWKQGKAEFAGVTLGYGYFTPDMENYRHPKPNMFGDAAKAPENPKVPLVVYLHGAGEGGNDPLVAYTGNKVAALSWPDIQRKLGGAAYILTPQCPTVWMDDGVEKLGHSNRSIYVKPLKACIDWFISEHIEDIDTDRIYIGGLSNGGFMTMRMLFDYPEMFAAALPACQAFYSDNVTDEMLESIKHIPIWFAHSKDDPIVPPLETAVPLYHRLKAAGADNVHMTYFDYIEDLSGMFKDELGRPMKYFGHAVWIHVFNDDCKVDFDGGRVIEGNEPVTMWEWVGKQI